MKAAIYYFSGTGNSLVVARDIAKKINGEIISIPSVMHLKKIDISADVVGIVFPDYHSNIPLIVKRFCDKVDNFNKYTFAVCTYGGSGPGPTVKHLKKIIKSRGGNLSAGFAVKMPYNYIIPSFSLKKLSFSVTLKIVPIYEQQKMFLDWNKKLQTICDYVTHQKEGTFETSAEMLFKFIDFFKLKESLGKFIWLRMAGFKGGTDLSFLESRQLMDHGFHADEKCIGCGTCERICPVSNIRLLEEKPSWMHHCEQCFACLQWCPEGAIQFGTDTHYRYHHPDVKIADMLHSKKVRKYPTTKSQ